jgi:hypothetical protein
MGKIFLCTSTRVSEFERINFTGNSKRVNGPEFKICSPHSGFFSWFLSPAVNSLSFTALSAESSKLATEVPEVSPCVPIVRNGTKRSPVPAAATQNQNTILYGRIVVCKAAVPVDSALYMLADMPSPTAEQIFVTVLKIPPARDCWAGGSDDITYIYTVS